MLKVIADFERWDWYAAGDRSLVKPAAVRANDTNAPVQVFWELGLIVAVPLALAVIAGISLA